MDSKPDSKKLLERIKILEAENAELKNSVSSSSNTAILKEEIYQTIFNFYSDAVFLIDNSTGNIIEANKTAELLYGFSHDELIKLKNTDLSNEPEQTRKVTLTGATIILERWHKKKDGTVFPVEITGSFFSFQGRNVHIAVIRDISKRVEALESLQVNEKIFRSYFDLSLVGIAITLPSMEWIKVNGKLCEILGYSCDELLKKTWAELTPEADLPAEMVKFKKALSDKNFSSSRFIKRLIRKDGKNISVDMAISAHRNESGEIDFLISMIQDVTQRFETETALSESELRFRELVDLLPQTVFEANKDGYFTFINKYAEKEFGYTAEEVVNKLHLADTLPDEEKERFYNNYQSIPTVGRTGREFNMLRKNNTKFTGLIHYAPIVRNNQFVGLRGIITNIEAQKLIEKELRESEENYHTIFELASDSIIIHDPDSGNILDANQNAVFSYGLNTIEELRSYPFWTDNSPFSNEDALRWIKKSVTDGPQIFEWLNKRIDGTFFWEEVHLTYIKIRGLNRVISIGRNITDRKRAEEKLERINAELQKRNEEYASLNKEYVAQNENLHLAKEKAEESDRLKSAFLANMSHEIRTPMNAIMGFSGLLANQNISSEKQNQYFQIIKRRASDLLKIIDDLLDISKIEANQMVINETTVNINSLLDELLEYFVSKKEMEKRDNIQISVSSQLSEADANVRADFGRLKQILFNLTENALKFTEKGQILISCQKHNSGKLLFSVKDTGIGIEPEMHQIIFQRFRQAGERKGETASGTGLGLAICKGLVELMGGEILMASEVNKGSEFFFTIPLKLSTEEVSEDDGKAISKTLKGKTILVVEDDEINTHYINEVLRMHKANILNAVDGKTALQICSQHPTIDAVLLDIKLPDCNGLGLIPQIKQHLPGAKIVIQSAYATNEDIEKGLNAGCDSYITKPMDANKLISKILEK